jgi:hypothetical protein
MRHSCSQSKHSIRGRGLMHDGPCSSRGPYKIGSWVKTLTSNNSKRHSWPRCVPRKPKKQRAWYQGESTVLQLSLLLDLPAFFNSSLLKAIALFGTINPINIILVQSSIQGWRCTTSTPKRNFWAEAIPRITTSWSTIHTCTTTRLIFILLSIAVSVYIIE